LDGGDSEVFWFVDGNVRVFGVSDGNWCVVS
jgi:hypothetical protein